ncbi:9_t:CDS:2, partial [Acaulospora colombiana]
VGWWLLHDKTGGKRREVLRCVEGETGRKSLQSWELHNKMSLKIYEHIATEGEELGEACRPIASARQPPGPIQWPTRS